MSSDTEPQPAPRPWRRLRSSSKTSRSYVSELGEVSITMHVHDRYMDGHKLPGEFKVHVQVKGTPKECLAGTRDVQATDDIAACEAAWQQVLEQRRRRSSGG